MAAEASYAVVLVLTVVCSSSVVRGIDIHGGVSDAEVLEGGNVTFWCNFTGTGNTVSPAGLLWTAPKYHYVDLNSSLGKISATFDSKIRVFYLHVERLDVSDSGEYDCQISEVMKRKPIFLTVNRRPESVSISGGKEVRLTKDQDNNITCIVKNSKPPAIVQWQASDANVLSPPLTVHTPSEDNNLLFNTMSVLSVKPTNVNKVNYTCKVTNPEFLTPMETTVSADILHAPVISSMKNEPLLIKYREHGSVTLECIVATSNPTPVTWRWFQGELLLADKTASSYSIADIPASLHGQPVTCEASNTIGAANFTYPFIVEYGPRLKQPMKNLEVDLDEKQSFTCDVDSNPAPTIYWRKMGSSQVVKTEKTLQFPSIKEADIGGYTCIASTEGFAETVEENAYLLLKYRPSIVGEEEYYISQGEDAEVTCNAISIPKSETTFAWTKGRNSEKIDLSKKEKYTESQVVTIHGKKSILTVKSVTSDDFAFYNCTVENPLGRDFKTFRIQQKDDFPWQYAAIGGGSGIGLILLITLIVCCVKRRRKASSRNDSGSVSMASHKTDIYVKNLFGERLGNNYYGTGDGNAGLWNGDQFPGPDGYDQECYPLRMDMGYETMESSRYPVQPEVYQTFPARHETYSSYYAAPPQFSSNVEDTHTLVRPGHSNGFYSMFPNDQQAPGPYNSLRYQETEYYSRAMAEKLARAMAENPARTAAEAGTPLHVDLPPATEASHYATIV